MRYVSMRQFQQNMYGEIQNLPIILTRRGEPVYTIEQVEHESVERVNISITKNQREEVFKRDNYMCKDCNSKEYLQIDHIRPRSAGGTSTLNNYETVCAKCNIRRYHNLVKKSLIHYHECEKGIAGKQTATTAQTPQKVVPLQPVIKKESMTFKL